MHKPFGLGTFSVVLKFTDLPVKQRVLSFDDPPNALQKSDWDCQRSVSLEGEEDGNGAKGEFLIGVSLHVSQTCVQKLLAVFFDEVLEIVELQSTGIVRIFGSIVNRSAENGSHLAQRTD